MTKAQYEVYGVIDELQSEVSRLRHLIEKDWRGKSRQVSARAVYNALELLESAMKEWEEEDPNALSVDVLLASR